MKEFCEANLRVKERNRRPRAYLALGVKNAEHRARDKCWPRIVQPFRTALPRA